MNIISTWFYASPFNEIIKYPNLRGRSNSKKFQNIYWKNIICFFWSAYKTNPDSKLILFLNKEYPEYIDNYNLSLFFKNYKIEIIYLEGDLSIPPPNYYKVWNSQFVIIDILNWFHLNYNDNTLDNILLLDSDCIFLKNINENIVLDLNKFNLLRYDAGYDLYSDINGLNRIKLKELYSEYFKKDLSGEFYYSGGEFICFQSNQIQKIYPVAKKLYDESINRFKNNIQKFNEEAHLLSAVYHYFDFNENSANKFIKRIWTNRAIYSNIENNENDLIIWHIPSEKSNGFIKLFELIQSNKVKSVNIIFLNKLFRIKINKLQVFSFKIEKMVRFILFQLKK
jgi:hypothetical protein